MLRGLLASTDRTAMSTQVGAVNGRASPVDLSLPVRDALKNLKDAQPGAVSFPT